MGFYVGVGGWGFVVEGLEGEMGVGSGDAVIASVKVVGVCDPSERNAGVPGALYNMP